MIPDEGYFERKGITTVAIHVSRRTEVESWVEFAKEHGAVNMAKITAPNGDLTLLLQLATPKRAHDVYNQVRTDREMVQNRVIIRLVSLGAYEFGEYMQKCIGAYAQLRT